MKLLEQLSMLRDQGIIQDIDLELCRFLQHQQPGITKEVLLAAFLISYLYREGDVCLLLEKYAGEPLFSEHDLENNPAIVAPELSQWTSALSESPLVGSPGDFKPLILDDTGRLYLHKLWTYEEELAYQLLLRGSKQVRDINSSLLKDGLSRLFSSDGSVGVDWQQIAAALAVKHKLSVISGGPGTGKTSTVVRILALLLEQAAGQDHNLHIALAAPTGKAAARLKDSILEAKEDLPVSEQVVAAIPDQTMTLHQLLGARRNTASLKYNKDNPLPYDLIIVDEASMIDQALMSKLLEALLSDTRLILLGDKDQLASVEAGSVLGDICSIETNRLTEDTAGWLSDLALEVPEAAVNGEARSFSDNITLLTKSYRFGPESGIARVASQVNSGASEKALDILNDPDYKDVGLLDLSTKEQLRELLQSRLKDYFGSIQNGRDAQQALDAFNSFRVLSAHRRGPLGVEHLNSLVEQLLQEQGYIPKYQQWYPGRPVIISENDHTQKLYNGDTGICLPDEQGELKVYFEHEQTLRAISPARLPSHNTAYALTVHKSQGSEFEEVFLMLPQKSSKVLSRELIYTAITRARTNISIVGRKAILSEAIQTPLVRSSGLRLRLWD